MASFSSVIHFIWLDTNVNSSSSKELLTKMQQLNASTIGFTDKGECQRFIERGSESENKRCILIVSGSLGKELVPDIHSCDNLISIYVYCGNIEFHRQWANKYYKVTYHFM